ncbi:hypothetical protein GJAV_G00134640 [Gymnothorax javanicus]|nr:hypothetical protein GJAV_G00134640 [Gymnothorax javanicus]
MFTIEHSHTENSTRTSTSTDLLVKMVLFILSALIFIIHPLAPEGSSQLYRTLVPNVIVVQKDLEKTVEVPLLCGAAYQNRQISWRREGVPMPKQGNHITVTVEEMMGGDFSCHDDAGTLLNHQLVLVQLTHSQNQRKILQKTEVKDYISCISRNYSGVFHCSWRWSPNREGAVVHVSAKRSPGKDNITCSVDEDGSGITCLDQFQCSYAEEVDYIYLSVWVRYMYRLEEYSSQFTITEIVKPDKIKVVPLKKEDGCDFKHAEVIRTGNQTYTVANRKEFRLCVRAQDELCNSGWSDWSQYEVRRSQ